MAITAAQLKGRIAELLEISKKEADDFLWAFEQIMVETVQSADSVTIPGVGKLTCVVAPSRKARNPATGESIVTKPKVNVKFAITKPLKDQAPSLTSKAGKALLAAAEEKQAKREKAKRKREREAEKGNTKKKTVGRAKATNKVAAKTKKTKRAKARI